MRDRIKDLRRVKACELLENPKNWRRHPETQKSAMRQVLESVGIADALIARERDDGKLELIDGHLRREILPNETVPVLVVDLSDEEADFLLLTLDPISELAVKSKKALAELRESCNLLSDELIEALGLADSRGALKPKQFATPRMAWVLIGCPLGRYGEIDKHIQAIAKFEDVFCETAINNE